MLFLSLVLTGALVSVVQSTSWIGLSFDGQNFMCRHFDDLCENVLEEIGCDEHARTSIGCPNYPETYNNVSYWKGTCKCTSPMIYSDNGGITTQMISNRLVPDMSWMMEPWNTGPPYDLMLSYTNICQKFLDRIHCPENKQKIVAQNTLPVSGGSNYQCTCGTLSASSQVNKIIMDKLNDYNLKTLPIWSNPAFLNVPLSACIVLICGKLGAIIAVYLKLPPIIGFLLAGLGLQNILSPMFLKGAGYPYPSPNSELKLLALIIVLMRAGLAIKFEEILQYSWPTAVLSLLPYMGEFFVFMYVGTVVFGYPAIEMGLFASVMAPLGPSVIISALLLLVGSKRDHGYAPKQVLISAPIEAVIAIILFGIFYTLNQTDVPPLYPWVKILPLYANCLLIPVNLLFSTIMGIVTGWACSRYINYRIKLKTDFIWVRISKNPQMGSSTADLVFVLLVACYTMYTLCNQAYIQQSSGVLVVFVACITVSRLVDPVTASDIAQGLKGIWVFAEVFLFTLTGTALSFDSTNGPLYGQRGLDGQAIGQLVGVMVAGTAGRMASLAIAIATMVPSLPKHRQELRWIVPFYFNLLIYQLPKATVQATLGSVAYTTQAIPGPSGVNKGLKIAQSTAFTVLIYAPLGTLLIKFVGSPLSVYLTNLDKNAGWNIAKNRPARRNTLKGPEAFDEKAIDEAERGETEEEDLEDRKKIEAAKAANAAAHPVQEELEETGDIFEIIMAQAHALAAGGSQSSNNTTDKRPSFFRRFSESDRRRKSSADMSHNSDIAVQKEDVEQNANRKVSFHVPNIYEAAPTQEVSQIVEENNV